MKKKIIVLVFCLFISMCFNKITSEAASGMITFSTKNPEVKTGKKFTVVCSIQSSDNIGNLQVYVSYDSSLMNFVSGGNEVSGGAGLLTLQVQNTTKFATKKTFVLKFQALKAGATAISISDKALVYDESGNKMSMSSNRLSLNISDTAAVSANAATVTAAPANPSTPPAGQTAGQPPVASAGPGTPDNVSKNNNLSSCKVSNGDLSPAFSSNVTDYKLTVENKVDTLYLSAATSDQSAAYKISGNENLVIGSQNKVMIEVTAPSGDKKTYNIAVTRETEEQTRKRQESEKGQKNSGIDFSVTQDGDKIYLQDSYKFQVVNLEDQNLIPAGFVKTNVILNSINVPAYTIENDLDNDFLLIYAMNSDDEKNFYQFDRVEKTLQRYTGDLIKKVNESAVNSKTQTADQYKSNVTKMAVIIGVLAGACLLMMIGIVSMFIKMRNATNHDELNL